uniref:(California timema) hypothetical protein n=1 Tax=Timema californicum TaxID=61474 RepID=A0A7R9J1N6_TIMCA|nr:unnamed protein product [Timema californicum]
MKFCSAMLLLSFAALHFVCGLSSFTDLEVNDDRAVRVYPTMEEWVAAILTRLHLAEVEASWDSHTPLDIHIHVADDCWCVPWYEELDVTEQWLEDLKTFGRNLHDLLDREDEDELFYTINQHLELSDLIMSYVYVMQVIKIGVVWNVFAFVEDIKNNVQLPNDIMEEIHLHVAQAIASLRTIIAMLNSPPATQCKMIFVFRDRCSEERKVVPDVMSNSFHSSLRFLLASIALSSPIEPAESHYSFNLVTLHRSHSHQTT